MFESLKGVIWARMEQILQLRMIRQRHPVVDNYRRPAAFANEMAHDVALASIPTVVDVNYYLLIRDAYIVANRVGSMMMVNTFAVFISHLHALSNLRDSEQHVIMEVAEFS